MPKLDVSKDEIGKDYSKDEFIKSLRKIYVPAKPASKSSGTSPARRFDGCNESRIH
jgi:hypothetical protein